MLIKLHMLVLYGIACRVCEAKLQEFRGLVKYVMLREEANYADLGSMLQADLLESGVKEEGR